MSTEIIKLNSIKNNLQSLFSSLLAKFQSHKNYDITLVIQENCEQEQLSGADFEQEGVRPIKPSVNFSDNALILNQDSDRPYSMNDAIIQEHACQTEHHTTLAQPPKLPTFSHHRTSNKENQPQRSRHQTINNYTQTEAAPENKQSRTEIGMDESIKIGPDHEHSVRVNNFEQESKDSEQQESEEDNDSNAGFLIEKHLNQALGLIEHNRTNDLEDFLYNYKERYSFINLRTQTKWNMLMGHCKEVRQEYERAATNYCQVISNLKDYPRLLTIDIGYIYSKLGRCYHQIQQWNHGIAAYTEALNYFKASKRVTEYANCMVSLGVLYQEVNHFIEAQKCFLVAYNLKSHEGEKHFRCNLLPVLFNLLECNFNIKNYKQASDLLSLVGEIIAEADNVDSIHVVTYNVKQAKLHFFTGQLQLTHQHCQKALSMLVDQKCESKEYGEVLEVMGLLKQERGEYVRSKEYFDRALKALQKHLSVDSPKIEILRRRIDNLSRFTLPTRSQSLPRQTGIHDDNDVESGQSDCVNPDFYEQ